MFIYKRWSFIILLNNLVFSTFLVFSKKLLFLKFDLNKFNDLLYFKKIKLQTKKILKFKSFVYE